MTSWLLIALAVTLCRSTGVGGDVEAFIDSTGDLVILGDEGANAVGIRRSLEPPGLGVLVVGDSGTTINGLPGRPGVVLLPTSKSIHVHLNAGNDVLRLDGRIAFHVFVRGGSGDDEMIFGQPEIVGDFSFHGDGGRDRVRGEDSTIRGDCAFSMGADDSADAVDVVFLGVSGILGIDMGDGDNEVLLVDTFAGGLHIRGGGGSDQIVLARCTAGGGFLAPGAGADHVDVVGLTIHGDLVANLGAGMDTLAIGGVQVVGVARIEGGPQKDVLRERGLNFASSFKVVGFESVAGTSDPRAGPFLVW
jgi:hypothetical protein